jgi:hypothetical protein
MSDRMNFQEWLDLKREEAPREFGRVFDDSALAPQFIRFFETGQRIEVSGPSGVRRGRVGVTAGWCPCFLLMHRRSDRGSSDLLGLKDRVTRVIIDKCL